MRAWEEFYPLLNGISEALAAFSILMTVHNARPTMDEIFDLKEKQSVAEQLAMMQTTGIFSWERSHWFTRRCCPNED
jgi:hypothetical protein